MKRVALLLLLFVAQQSTAQEPVDLVNPFVGTTNFGTTNPGAVSPNGLMSVVPFNVMGSEDNLYDKDARWWSAPYEFHNKFFTGFAHVALSGVGCPELGSLLTMPTSGELDVEYRSYGSTYSLESASPGYYSLHLDKYNIKAEATATVRSSVERYTFPEGQGNILMNLGEGLTNESGAMIRRVSATQIEGVKLMGTFCYTPQAVFPLYFVMEVSKRPSSSGYWKMQPEKSGVEAEWDQHDGTYKLYPNYGRELAGDDIGYFFSYEDLEEGEQIEVRIGVSMVSTQNARENMEHEVIDQSFDRVAAATREQWNRDLGRIRISGGSAEQQEVFYTALYHTLIHPNILNDINGEYPLMESFEVGESASSRYTVFSLWDTYRNLHQLMTLVYPERQIDMVRSMVDMYKEWGWLPRWELYGRETFTMSGDPAIPIIVDTWFKGLRDFDIEVAYEAMLKSANTPSAENVMRRDIDPYIERGYIPAGMYSADLSGDNSVSRALEYFVADHALSELAKSLGFDDDAKIFYDRSMGYRNYYCPEFGTLRPITESGEFYSPFNPQAGENFEHAVGFHEGSAWNYTFFVPHDIAGLSKLMGGKKRFIDKLQMVFDSGLYDPSNEPNIAYPYLFSYFRGEEWRTQREVKRLLSQYFSTAPDGIPGNDDTGTMSAWAVFSMMGLYPDCPGSPYYTLTTPTFDRVEIDTEQGVITIEKEGQGDFIKNISLDGKRVEGYRLSHAELLEKRKLNFKLQKTK